MIKDINIEFEKKEITEETPENLYISEKNIIFEEESIQRKSYLQVDSFITEILVKSKLKSLLDLKDSNINWEEFSDENLLSLIFYLHFKDGNEKLLNFNSKGFKSTKHTSKSKISEIINLKEKDIVSIDQDEIEKFCFFIYNNYKTLFKLPNHCFESFKIGKSNLLCMNFSLDKIYFISGNSSGELFFSDMNINKVKVVSTKTNSAINAVSFSNNGKYIYSGQENGEIIQWEINNYNLELIKEINCGFKILSLVVSEEFVAIGGETGEIFFYENNIRLKLMKKIKDHSSKIIFLKFINNDLNLISGSHKNVKIYNTKSFNQVDCIKNVDNYAYEISNDEKIMATSEKRTISLWSLNTLNIIHYFKKIFDYHSNDIYIKCLKFNFNNELLIAGLNNGMVHVFNVFSGICLRIFEMSNNSPIVSMVMNKHNKITGITGNQLYLNMPIFLNEPKKSFEIIKAPENSLIKKKDEFTSINYKLGYNGKNNLIAVGDPENSQIHLFSLDKNKIVKKIKDRAMSKEEYKVYKQIKFNFEGNQLAAVTISGIVSIWNLDKTEFEIEKEDFILKNNLGEDNKFYCIEYQNFNKGFFAASDSLKNQIFIWENQILDKPIKELTYGKEYKKFCFLAFTNKSNNFLISADDENEILVWDLIKSKVMKKFEKNNSSISFLFLFYSNF